MESSSVPRGSASLIRERFKKFREESLNRRMIGFALCRAWVFVSFFSTSILLFATDPTAVASTVYRISLVALVATLVIFALLNQVTERLFMNLPGQIFPIAANIIGSILFFFSSTATVWGLVCMYACSILTGLGSGLILLYWGRVYSLTGGPTSAAEGSLAFILASLLVPCFAICPTELQMALIIILPAVSGILLVQEFKPIDHSPFMRESGTGRRPSWRSRKDASGETVRKAGTGNLIKLAVSSLVFGTVVSIVRTVYSSQTRASIGFADNLIFPIAAIVSGCIIIGIILVARRLDLALTYKPVLIFMTVACVLLPFFDNQYFLCYTLTMVGYFCFENMNWAMMADITLRHNFSAYHVYGFGRAAVSGGILIGELVGISLGCTGGCIPQEILYGLSFGLILLMIVVYTLTLTERDVAKITRMESRPYKVSAEALSFTEAAASEEDVHPLTVEEKVDILAQEYDIDGRAYDVLMLLAKGRTAARIESELYISRGTVNTYSRRIYQKLGIHSKQELYDLVDAVEEQAGL